MKNKLEELPIEQFIYFALGFNVQLNRWIIKIGKTKTSIYTRTKGFSHAWDFELSELSNFDNFSKIERLRMKARKKARQGTKQGEIISREYEEAKIHFSFKDKNLSGLAEELCKHIAIREGLIVEGNTSEECWVAYPDFEKSKEARDEIRGLFIYAFNYFLEDFVLANKKWTTHAVEDFYDLINSKQE